MRVNRGIASAIASVALAAGGILAAGAAPASAASACQTWSDANTFGASCSGSGQIRVHAICVDGASKYSPYVNAGQWTYAYCSGHGGWKSASIQHS